MNEDEKSYIKEIQEHLKNNIDVKSKFEINVHRSNILNDSLNQFKNTNLKEYLKQLYIFLIEEDGSTKEISIKEWINLITEEIINPKYELFIQSNNKKYYPNTKSSINENHLDYFRFFGFIIALSIIHDASIHIYFSSFFIKHILHLQIFDDDLIDYDQYVYNSFQYMKNHDVDNISIFFETTINTAEGPKSFELIQNGSNIKITNENKYQYFNLMIDLLLSKSINDQTRSFCECFDLLIPHEIIEGISTDELNNMIYGSGKIDIEMMKKIIKVEEPYTFETNVIKYFFDAISKWSSKDLQNLIMFVTGIPYLSNDEPLFSIIKAEGQRGLPMAHTLIKQLYLPEYESEEELNKNLSNAVKFSSILIDN